MIEQKHFVRSYLFLLDHMIEDRPYKWPCRMKNIWKTLVELRKERKLRASRPSKQCLCPKQQPLMREEGFMGGVHPPLRTFISDFVLQDIPCQHRYFPSLHSCARKRNLCRWCPFEPLHFERKKESRKPHWLSHAVLSLLGGNADFTLLMFVGETSSFA